MLSLRESVKSRLTVDQRRKVLHLRDVIRFCNPFRLVRRFRNEQRMLPLPGGRTWRTNVPYFLQRSLQEGLIAYRYRDVPMLKHPVEIALYTRLIWETKPQTIFEIGSSAGGAALWMADLLKTFGIEGSVVSIDIKPPTLRAPNVNFLRGDANDLSSALSANALTNFPRPWLVTEDSSHEYEATLAVLRFFDPQMRSGEYMVIEGAGILELGQDKDRNGGPARAIAEFLATRGDDYEIDTRYCDQYGRNVTDSPNGYLRRR
jgi:cephalosporin hydroxylase